MLNPERKLFDDQRINFSTYKGTHMWNKIDPQNSDAEVSKGEESL